MSTDLQILVCAAGNLLLGIACDEVREVLSRTDGTSQDEIFARDVLGRSASSPTAERALLVSGLEPRRFIVDRVHGMRTVPSSDVRRIPSRLLPLGVPPWITGLVQTELGIVWFVDLPAAVVSHESEEQR